MERDERASWGLLVANDLGNVLQAGDEEVFLAGKVYRESIVCSFERMGVVVTIPIKSLGLGQQL